MFVGFPVIWCTVHLPYRSFDLFILSHFNNLISLSLFLNVNIANERGRDMVGQMIVMRDTVGQINVSKDTVGQMNGRPNERWTK